MIVYNIYNNNIYNNDIYNNIYNIYNIYNIMIYIYNNINNNIIINNNNFILQKSFFQSLQFLCCIQRNPSGIISKKCGRKDFSMEQLPIDSYCL